MKIENYWQLLPPPKKKLSEAEKDKYISTIAKIDKDMELRFYTYQ